MSSFSFQLHVRKYRMSPNSGDTILILVERSSSLSGRAFGDASICPRRKAQGRLQPRDEVIISQRSACALMPPKDVGLRF
jgi:hypothetical protein